MAASHIGELLIGHAEQFDNGAVFKRLGFLADMQPHDEKLPDECRARLTHGYAKLDPALRTKKLDTAWPLKAPKAWKGTA